MRNVDRKFKILAINPINGKIYTEADAILLCAKDACVPAALAAYQEECIRLGANAEHIESITLLRERVDAYQAQIQRRIPDTVGEELARCLVPNGPVRPPADE
jgi:hypothetical protein